MKCGRPPTDPHKRPKGKFYCPVCKEVYDGSELFSNWEMGRPWVCGNVLCGANVYRVIQEDAEEDKEK